MAPKLLPRITSVLLCVLLPMSVYATQFRDCGSTGRVWGVHVYGCEEVEACPLIRGNTSTLDVTFQANSSTATIKTLVHGEISSTFLPFAKHDGCKDSGLTCPLIPGENYTFHAEVNVKSYYPPIEVGVRFKLLDDNSDAVFCIIFPAKIE